jgi:hypothetical protein
LISEVGDSNPVAEPDAVGVHETDLATALVVIRSGVFLAAPGRVTFFKSGGDSADARRGRGEAALRFHLGDGRFRRATYFGQDAYSPDFAADAGAETGQGIPEWNPKGYLADYARSGFLRRIPFTREDAESTLSLIEEKHRRGVDEASYAPLKEALQEFLARDRASAVHPGG